MIVVVEVIAAAGVLFVTVTLVVAYTVDLGVTVVVAGPWNRQQLDLS